MGLGVVVLENSLRNNDLLIFMETESILNVYSVVIMRVI